MKLLKAKAKQRSCVLKGSIPFHDVVLLEVGEERLILASRLWSLA